jgi:hypothetical protein
LIPEFRIGGEAHAAEVAVQAVPADVIGKGVGVDAATGRWLHSNSFTVYVEDAPPMSMKIEGTSPRPRVNERITPSPPFTSAVERGEGSPDRASGGSIDVLRCTLEPSADLHPSLEKTRMALYRVLPFIPFPTSPGIVPRRPARHASAHHEPVSESERGGNRTT